MAAMGESRDRDDIVGRLTAGEEVGL